MCSSVGYKEQVPLRGSCSSRERIYQLCYGTDRCSCVRVDARQARSVHSANRSHSSLPAVASICSCTNRCSRANCGSVDSYQRDGSRERSCDVSWRLVPRPGTIQPTMAGPDACAKASAALPNVDAVSVLWKVKNPSALAVREQNKIMRF